MNIRSKVVRSLLKIQNPNPGLNPLLTGRVLHNAREALAPPLEWRTVLWGV